MNNKISTTYSKGLVIFASVAIAVLAGIIVLISIVENNLGLKIFFLILCGIFLATAIIVLFGCLFVRVYIEGDYLHSRFVFNHKRIKLEKVKTMILRNDVYFFYDQSGKKICSINAFDPNSPKIVKVLEVHGTKLIEENNDKDQSL